MLQVNERSAWAHLSDEDLKRAASSFLGDILQVPPMYSALKQKGVPLYVKARAGEVVERAARQLHIARFDVWRDAPGSQDVHFAVVRTCSARRCPQPSSHFPAGCLTRVARGQTCSKGTYIRSLAHDLGAALGTHAHLVALRRDSIGQHQVSNAWALESLLTSARAQRQA
jgi:tRNA pseudouridine55 synthase